MDRWTESAISQVISVDNRIFGSYLAALDGWMEAPRYALESFSNRLLHLSVRGAECLQPPATAPQTCGCQIGSICPIFHVKLDQVHPIHQVPFMASSFFGTPCAIRSLCVRLAAHPPAFTSTARFRCRCSWKCSSSPKHSSFVGLAHAAGGTTGDTLMPQLPFW
jgi:hypothetical protein